MRRLFFRYTEGWPGIALLLMRIASGAALFAGPGGSVIWDGIRIISGILLMSGLWTPVAGTLAVITQVWRIVDKAGDPWANLLLLIMGDALVFWGPASGRSTPGSLAGRGSTYRNVEDAALVAGNSGAKILFSSLENLCENSPMQIPSLSIRQAKPDEPCF